MSPATLLARLLVAAGKGIKPPAAGLWPIFIGEMATKPDLALCLYDTTGILDGRVRGVGTIIHPGLQLKVRSNTYNEGWDKITNLQQYLDTLNGAYTVEGTVYFVYCVKLANPPIPLGQEEGTRREQFTLNATITYTELP